MLKLAGSVNLRDMGTFAGKGSNGGKRPKGTLRPWKAALRNRLWRGPPAKTAPETAPSEPAGPLRKIPERVATAARPGPRFLPNIRILKPARRKWLWGALGAAALLAALAVWLRGRPAEPGQGDWAAGAPGLSSALAPAGSRGTPAGTFDPVRKLPGGINGILSPEESKKLSEGDPGVELDLDKLPRSDETVILLKSDRVPMLTHSAAPDMTPERP